MNDIYMLQKEREKRGKKEDFLPPKYQLLQRSQASPDRETKRKENKK